MYLNIGLFKELLNCTNRAPKSKSTTKYYRVSELSKLIKTHILIYKHTRCKVCRRQISSYLLRQFDNT